MHIHRTSSLFILAGTVLCCTLATSIATAYAGDACDVLISKAPLPQRTVLLSDGNAWSLFQQYLGEAENQAVKINLSKVKVVLASNKEKKEFRLDWKQMITGDSKREIWARMLKKVNADNDGALYKEAARQKWDVVCYSGSDTAVKEVRTAPSAAGKAGSGPIPLEARQHFQQGMQYAARRDFSNACKEFTSAIRVSPGYASAYSNRGVAYMQQKKFDLAEDDLKKAVELEPREGRNHYNLACWYSLQDQVGRGLASIDSALANGFNDYQALRKDRDLSALRKNPDWQKTLDKHKVFLGSGK